MSLPTSLEDRVSGVSGSGGPVRRPGLFRTVVGAAALAFYSVFGSGCDSVVDPKPPVVENVAPRAGVVASPSFGKVGYTSRITGECLDDDGNLEVMEIGFAVEDDDGVGASSLDVSNVTLVDVNQYDISGGSAERGVDRVVEEDQVAVVKCYDVEGLEDVARERLLTEGSGLVVTGLDVRLDPLSSPVIEGEDVLYKGLAEVLWSDGDKSSPDSTVVFKRSAVDSDYERLKVFLNVSEFEDKVSAGEFDVGTNWIKAVGYADEGRVTGSEEQSFVVEEAPGVILSSLRVERMRDDVGIEGAIKIYDSDMRLVDSLGVNAGGIRDFEISEVHDEYVIRAVGMQNGEFNSYIRTIQARRGIDNILELDHDGVVRVLTHDNFDPEHIQSFINLADELNFSSGPPDQRGRKRWYFNDNTPPGETPNPPTVVIKPSYKGHISEEDIDLIKEQVEKLECLVEGRDIPVIVSEDPQYYRLVEGYIGGELGYIVVTADTTTNGIMYGGLNSTMNSNYESIDSGSARFDTESVTWDIFKEPLILHEIGTILMGGGDINNLNRNFPLDMSIFVDGSFNMKTPHPVYDCQALNAVVNEVYLPKQASIEEVLGTEF